MIEFINSNNLGVFIEDLVLDRIEREIRSNVAPKFWKNFEVVENEMSGFEQFKTAVASLYSMLSSFIPILDKMELIRLQGVVSRKVYGEDKLINTFKVIVRSNLHAQLPLKHQVITEHFYRVAFKVFCNTDKLETGKFLVFLILLYLSLCNEF